MNALFSIPHPLPSILRTPFDGPTRRRCINGFQLSAPEVDRFNGVLVRLGLGQPLQSDQLASAGRELSRPHPHGAAPCIRQRLRWIAVLERLLGERHWTATAGATEAAIAIVDYAHNCNDLIPDWLPRVGRLDDAIVVEAAWPQVAQDVDEYLDYRRTRRDEAARRDRSPSGFVFTRDDWEQVRYERAALAQQQRRVRESSYLPASAPVFRIH